MFSILTHLFGILVYLDSKHDNWYCTWGTEYKEKVGHQDEGFMPYI